jgi:two-component system chemotaxis sensor kinase CheA
VLSAVEHETLLREAVRSGSPALVAIARGLADEPTSGPLGLLAREAQSVAARLGKGGLTTELSDNGLRLPRARFAALWAALGHVSRNAVDHGIETPSERVAAGKPAVGTLALSTRIEEGEVVIEIHDDGRGIDWELLASKARSQGHPTSTHEQRVAALLADGVTTRDDADESSGRGVGLAAVHAAAIASGGRIEIESRPGEGTLFRFRIPASASSAPAARAA